MLSLVTQRFPCGPTTMVATEFNATWALLIYICGKEEERYTEKKSNAAQHKLSFSKVAAIALVLFAMLASA